VAILEELIGDSERFKTKRLKLKLSYATA
jgi:hypothetical protein